MQPDRKGGPGPTASQTPHRPLLFDFRFGDVPMPLSVAPPDALANTYARSLFELAMDTGSSTLEASLAELQDILELARTDKKFNEFLASQTIPAKVRDASLVKIFKGRCSDLTLRFLRVLNDKARLSHLPAITEALDALVQEKFGRVEIDVFTAETLPPENLGQLAQRLGTALKKEVVLHTYVEPAMIGGVKLRLGDQLVDASIATQLNAMRDKLRNEGLAALRSKFDKVIES
jgi:F-type H+-transporting ATPase subunit delta